MVLYNLFKHKVHFRLVGDEPDRHEPISRSRGYHYVSNDIENGESIGVTNACDLYQDKLKPLFIHILSTMTHEIKPTIGRISIKVHLVCGEEHEDYDIVAYDFFPDPDYFSVTIYNSLVYTLPRNLLNDKFSIYVESYAYMIPKRMREVLRLMELNIRAREMNAAPDETFRPERCVICSDSAPNILYSDCGHIAVCSFCDNMKRSMRFRMRCDVCRTMISRRIKI